MKKCNHCLAENLDSARFCDSCGIKLFEEENTVVTENIEEISVSFPTENQPITTDALAPNVQNPNPVSTERKHGGLLAFSIINICSIVFSVFTLYASVFTMILGIIATVTLSKAGKEPNDEFYKIKKKNALILNIAGLIIAILGFMAFIGLVIYVIVNGFTDLATKLI